MNLRTPMVAVLLSGILLTTSACSSNEPDDESSESAQSEETRPAPIEIEDGTVPDLKGRSLHESIVALRELELRYEIEGEDFVAEDEAESTREWQVVEQSPAPGAEAERRDTVELTVERK